MAISWQDQLDAALRRAFREGSVDADEIADMAWDIQDELNMAEDEEADEYVDDDEDDEDDE